MIQDLAYASPLLIVATVGLVVLMVGVFSPRGGSNAWLSHVLTVGFLAALAALWWLWRHGPIEMVTPAMRTALVMDGFSLALSAVILVGAALTSLAASDYLAEQGADHHEYYALVAFVTLGMMAMVMAGDFLTLFIALEVMSIGIYVMAGFKRQSPFATESAVKYFILGSFASALLLLGVAFLYGVTGEISFAGLARAFAFVGEGEAAPLAADPLAAVGMLLVLSAFAFKIAAAPFHMWTPDVYEGALSSVTGFMAVGVKTAAFGALARVVLTCFGDETFRTAPLSWEALVAALAVVSMLTGNLMALAQTNLKRMLAYSAIAHTGYILVALLSAPRAEDGAISVNQLGAGLVFYLLAYTLANAAAFGVAAAVSGDETEDVSEPAYAGLAKREPFLAFALAVAMLSLLGIPATAGFMGKLTVFADVLSNPGGDYLWLVVFAVINSVISAWYYLRVILVAYMKDEEVPLRVVRGRTLRTSLAVATALTLLVGLLPGKALRASALAGRSLARTATPGLMTGDAAGAADAPADTALAPRVAPPETTVR